MTDHRLPPGPGESATGHGGDPAGGHGRNHSAGHRRAGQDRALTSACGPDAVPSDETDLGWGELPDERDRDDERILREVPPHHLFP